MLNVDTKHRVKSLHAACATYKTIGLIELWGATSPLC